MKKMVALRFPAPKCRDKAVLQLALILGISREQGRTSMSCRPGLAPLVLTSNLCEGQQRSGRRSKDFRGCA